MNKEPSPNFCSRSAQRRRLAQHAHRAFVIVTALGLVACDVNLENTLDALTGRQSSVVVLRDKPTRLGPEPLVIAAGSESMKVLGEWSSVCLAMRGDTPMQDTREMDRIFAEAMGTAKVKVQLTLTDGKTVTLRPPLQAWSLHGKVLRSNELSACASTPCNANLPVGSVVSKVEVSADVPITTQGIYWLSEADLPKPPAPQSQTAAASTLADRSSCST